MRQQDVQMLAAGEFKARWPWFGGDLQTLRNIILRKPVELSSWPPQRLIMDLRDGSGDRLLAVLQGEPGDDKPLVVLIHGLTGSQDSAYLRASARHFLTRGYAVLRLNLRGAGPGRGLACQQYHAGRSADLDAALAAFRNCSPRGFDGGLFLIGYSLGANMLLKFLAEEGRDWPIRAAASISAPIDLRAAQQRLMAPRNRLYHYWLLRNMRREALATPGGLGTPYDSRLRRLRDVFAFDDRFVAPRNGFTGALDYYARCSAEGYLPAVAVPTLVIHAQDDPWIPFEAYRRFDWRCNPNLQPLLPRSGGHVGFHDADDVQRCWHDRRIADFFAGRFV